MTTPQALTDEQVMEFGALCVMNRHRKLTARELFAEYRSELASRAAPAAPVQEPVPADTIREELAAAVVLFACHCRDATARNWLDRAERALAQPEPLADEFSRFQTWARPFTWSGDKAAMDLAWLTWQAATHPLAPAQPDTSTEQSDHHRCDLGGHCVIGDERGGDHCGVDECALLDSLGAPASPSGSTLQPSVSAAIPSACVGDYVLATKWSDGDPGDPWAVGFYAGVQYGDRHMVNDGEGKNIRPNGYRSVGRITHEVGAWLLKTAAALEASPPGTVNLWTMLTPLARGIDSPEGVETGTGSTAEPQEPDPEGTRPEGIAP